MPKDYDAALAEQAKRANGLRATRCCPNCQQAISLIDALSLIHGGGVTYAVSVRLPNGEIQQIDVRQFNPQTMLLDDGRSRDNAPGVH